MAVQGTVSGLWKLVGIPTGHITPQYIAVCLEFIVLVDISFLYISQPHKLWHQPIAGGIIGHASYPTYKSYSQQAETV